MKLKYHVKHFIQNLYILETYFTELYDLIIVCIYVDSVWNSKLFPIG